MQSSVANARDAYPHVTGPPLARAFQLTGQHGFNARQQTGFPWVGGGLVLC
jgi:hypothetical protein